MVVNGSNAMKSRVLYWFRTDLRLHDSPALHAALSLKPDVLYPVWTWDPQYVFAHRVAVNRFNFLLESMHDLSESLTKCNDKTKLFVLRGAPQTLLPELWKAWNITHLVYERDTAGYAAIRDSQINKLAAEAGVEVLDIHGHTLYDPKAIIDANNAKATVSLSTWQKAASHLDAPARPLPAPQALPPPGDLSLPKFLHEGLSADNVLDLNKDKRTDRLTCYGIVTYILANFPPSHTQLLPDTIAGPKGDFSVPTLDELGFPAATTSLHGGETEALRRLKAYCENAEQVATFAKPKTSPAEFDPPETTVLSPYLKFGCLGVREFLWQVRDTISQWKQSGGARKAQATKEPENLEGQLYFRDMYYAAEYAQGLAFGQIRGNSICRLIDWRLHNQYDESGTKIEPRPRGDDVDEARLAAWRDGKTGFPWIDAIMRQLRQEGWIHHLARHSVACFLTRGQCYISWERGAEAFEDFLIDWDPCANAGNWMWLSCSAFYSMYYRVYGVQSFPSKYDRTGKLVRRFCPELAKFPDKYIYSPHLAPKSVQEQAGCIIGKDYPFPMLDEAHEKEQCIARIKVAYQRGLYGTSLPPTNGSKEHTDVLHDRHQDASKRSKRKNDDANERKQSKRSKKVKGEA